MTDEHVPQHAAEPGLGDDLGLHDRPHTHRHRKRSSASCLVMLVVLGLLLGAVYVGLTRGVDWAKDQFADPEDYPGPGTGSVLIEVEGGDSATAIAHTLEDADVVASAEAFIDAANKSPQDASGIQVGFYELKLKMKAKDALAVLADPDNIRTSRVTVPEGMRVVDVVDLLVDKTGEKRKAFLRALDRPRALGLPDYAHGNAEGYLFPATYAFAPNETPAGMLRMMVDRWRQSAEENDLETRAEELGYKPAQIMTIASLIEAEGRGEDMPRIARVIYNRLGNPGTAGTVGKLQIDASVNYGLGQRLGVALTSEQLQQDTPYNTYTRAGLPPTPIEAPGDAAIEAALNPADGDWYYYVTVDLATGETKFAETPEEFATYKAEYQEYCQTSDAC